MDTNANIITTMGLISNEVYNTTNGKDYFKDTPDDMIVNGKIYKVLDHKSTSITDFQGLLLEEIDSSGKATGKYVVAFRGTESITDKLVDFVIAGHYNAQYSAAVDFVNSALERNGIDISNLTLTGHSLGGILTQQVGAKLKLKGYAYNPLGANALVKYPLTTNPLLAILNAVNAGSSINWAKDKIVNVSYHDDGTLNGDILSNLATALSSKHLGNIIPIFGKDVGASGHSLGVLNSAIGVYTALLHGTNNSIGYVELSQAFASNGFSNTDDFNRTAQTIGTYLTGNSSASIELLKDNSREQIINLAKTDDSFAYALDKLNGFVIK